MNGCIIYKCPRRFYARNMCKRHYARWWRTGNAQLDDLVPKINVISELDLYWLAGIFEGEGSFGLTGHKNPRAYAKVGMTDQDVILRIKKIIGIGTICEPRIREAHWKQLYLYTITGLDAEILIIELSPLMGKRRSKKIQEVLSKSTLRIID